jgi:hypothetical protein
VVTLGESPEDDRVEFAADASADDAAARSGGGGGEAIPSAEDMLDAWAAARRRGGDAESAAQDDWNGARAARAAKRRQRESRKMNRRLVEARQGADARDAAERCRLLADAIARKTARVEMMVAQMHAMVASHRAHTSFSSSEKAAVIASQLIAEEREKVARMEEKLRFEQMRNQRLRDEVAAEDADPDRPATFVVKRAALPEHGLGR